MHPYNRSDKHVLKVAVLKLQSPQLWKLPWERYLFAGTLFGGWYIPHAAFPTNNKHKNKETQKQGASQLASTQTKDDMKNGEAEKHRNNNTNRTQRKQETKTENK